MNDSRLDAGLRPGISTFPMKHQILTIRLSLQSVFRFCRQIYTQPVRTLQDNVSLVTPALLQELNALLVREGHAVAGKPPGTALDGRVDSFVVETDVALPDGREPAVGCDAGAADGGFGLLRIA